MAIIKTLVSLGLLLSPLSVSAKEAVSVQAQYVAAMCSASGDWTGSFEQYNETGLFRTSRLDATFLCQPSKDVLVETNVFLKDGKPVFPTLKVIFPTKKPAEMQMSYFYGGIEKVYFFKAAKVTYTDDTKWTTIRESAGRLHESDKNPPLSRYTHIRNGDDLTMIREVKNDSAQSEWTLSSKLLLKKKP